jgi:hypothetical protein
MLLIIGEYFFIPFGILAVLLAFSKKLFPKKKDYISDLDLLSTKVMIILGALFFVIWAFSITINLFFTENNLLKEQFFGPYSYGLWTQPLFWFLFSQSFRIRSIKKSLVLKLIFSLSFILTFEKLAILITAFHRGYQPSSWSLFPLDAHYFSQFVPKLLVYLILLLFLKFVCNKFWIKMK